jgi:hypothetical protein
VKHGDHECVLDVLRDAGLAEREAFRVAMEFTCFPMDCKIAVEQAREYLRALGAIAIKQESGL